MRNDKAKTIACLLALAIMFLLASKVGGVAKPVHAAFGWTVDSIYWLHIVDSVRTDSSGKLYSVTEWPDTNFDLSYGSVHQIRFIYWPPGLDSANWQFDFDMYDYNNANCVGGAPYVAGLWVWDTANDVGISRPEIAIKVDSAQGSTYKFSLGEVSGYVEFGLPNGDYVAVSGKPGYSIPNHSFTIASAAYSDTIKGYQIQLPAPPVGGVPTTTVVIFYYRHGTAVKGARLVVRNQNVATDTTNDVVIGPVEVSKYTDGDGFAYVFAPRSYIYNDSLKALYDISLYHRGRLVKLWSDHWLPDQDTLRLVVED